MLFNSIHFLIFFPVVTTLYFLLPHRFRWMLLLAASCYFYMAFIPAYILILAVTIVIDYFAGIYIERSEGKKRKKFLALSIVSLILVLFVFKYFNFVNQSFADVFKTFELEYPVENIGLILPIGLSFHTFQSLSYVVEVYRGRQKAEKNFGIYSLFVMFYPQLVAGPIERPQQLLYQFYERHRFEYRRIADGLKLMAWGMFKKVVIADRLAVFVNQVYDNPQNYEGISMVIATVFFAFQIYCDFSGYSDIAIGSAQVMGFKLMQNFNRPYFSKSISEFWKRWHISLSTWFRDYLYIPLGGNRVGIPRWYFNLFFTFMVSGLWHGANWTFVIWGALHGTYLIIGILTRNFREKFVEITGLAKAKRLHRFMQVMITAALVCFSWVFFRAMNLHDAMLILTNMIKGIGNVTQMFGPDRVHILYLGRNMLEFSICILLIGFLGIVELIQRRGSIIEMINSKPAVYRWALYYLILVAIILLGQYEISQRFIYFQF